MKKIILFLILILNSFAFTQVNWNPPFPRSLLWSFGDVNMLNSWWASRYNRVVVNYSDSDLVTLTHQINPSTAVVGTCDWNDGGAFFIGINQQDNIPREWLLRRSD